MFCKFKNAFDTSPELKPGIVYYLQFTNIGTNGVIGVTMPQRNGKGIPYNKEWKGIYTSYGQFLEDWEPVK